MLHAFLPSYIHITCPAYLIIMWGAASCEAPCYTLFICFLLLPVQSVHWNWFKVPSYLIVSKMLVVSLFFVAAPEHEDDFTFILLFFFFLFFFYFREVLREMPEPLTVKRAIKSNLVHFVGQKSKQVPLSTWKLLKYTLSTYLRKVSWCSMNQVAFPHSSSSTVWIIYKLADGLSKRHFHPTTFHCIFYVRFPPHTHLLNSFW